MRWHPPELGNSLPSATGQLREDVQLPSVLAVIPVSKVVQ